MDEISFSFEFLRKWEKFLFWIFKEIPLRHFCVLELWVYVLVHGEWGKGEAFYRNRFFALKTADFLLCPPLTSIILFLYFKWMLFCSFLSTLQAAVLILPRQKKDNLGGRIMFSAPFLFYLPTKLTGVHSGGSDRTGIGRLLSGTSSIPESPKGKGGQRGNCFQGTQHRGGGGGTKKGILPLCAQLSTALHDVRARGLSSAKPQERSFLHEEAIKQTIKLPGK